MAKGKKLISLFYFALTLAAIIYFHLFISSASKTLKHIEESSVKTQLLLEDLLFKFNSNQQRKEGNPFYTNKGGL